MLKRKNDDDDEYIIQKKTGRIEPHLKMLELRGNNLGKRHEEINSKVKELISNRVNFDEIKNAEEKSDVDRRLKIDVASEYKNVDYILETLKSGDTFYITRALKCVWLYEDDYSTFIEPQYLHQNIFPFMSQKMKKKMLTAVSMYVRNEERVLSFYKYCKSNNLKQISIKLLYFASESEKLKVINEENDDFFYEDYFNVCHFVGNSFILAHEYLKILRRKWQIEKDIHNLCYLYSVSKEEYLDIFEKYADRENDKRFGLRISKEIITKHNERVSNNVALYYNTLNIGVIVKHGSCENAKSFAIAILPDTADEFWQRNFYSTHKKILNKIPSHEIYEFIREIFMSKYKDALFEMDMRFYNLKYYQLMSDKEREVWALKHLEESKEHFGEGEDYKWYKFVNFDRAFSDIKKLIYFTTTPGKRAKMINVLVLSAKNQNELETLFKYYYDRHINESENSRDDFIKKVIDHHNAFKFSSSCWTVFYKVLCSFQNCNSFFYRNYWSLSVIYHVIHQIDVPEFLRKTINKNTVNTVTEFLKMLSQEEIAIVHQYYIDFFIDQIKEIDNIPYDQANKDKVIEIINCTLNVLSSFNKNKDDCPEIVLKYIKLEWDTFKDHNMFKESKKEEKYTVGRLMRLLKQDIDLLIKEIPRLKQYIYYYYSYNRLFNIIINKLKIYFANDAAKTFLNYFENNLSSKDIDFCEAGTSVAAIIQLTEANEKIEFISKYIPSEAKIDYSSIDNRLLLIQQGICRYVYYSRPPVPLTNILPYIKGDYVHYCLPLFNSYFMNLPMNQVFPFVESLLDSPVSVQKHGLRLAFKCFSKDHFKKLIVKVWTRNKNISLRKIVYMALYEKIKSADKDSKDDFFEIFNKFTLDLHEDDDEAVFSDVKFNDETLQAEYLKTIWITVSRFSDEKIQCINRKNTFIKQISCSMKYMDREFCHTNIIEEFIKCMLIEKQLRSEPCSKLKDLIKAKWKLCVSYIIFLQNKDLDHILKIMETFVNKCVEIRQELEDQNFVNKFMFDFLKSIFKECRSQQVSNESILSVLEYILKVITELFPLHEIYLFYWESHLMIIYTKVKMMHTHTNNMSAETIANNFATEVLKFLKEMKEKGMFYYIFYPNIGKLMQYCAFYLSFSGSFIDNDIFYHFCMKLLESEMTEAKILSYLIYDANCEKDCETGLATLQKLNESEDLVLKSYIHHQKS